MNVPNAPGGFQYANSGVAMAGVVTYVWEQAPDWPNYREYIGAQLLSTLNIGQKYFMSFFLNFSGYLQGWQKIGADKLGVKFSTVMFSEFNVPSLNNSSHLFTDSIYVDTNQWYKVSGSFIADSAYNYIILGNFHDSAQTDTMLFGGPPFGGSLSYYYIDDVCVTTDSVYNETWTGMVENYTDVLPLVYPNPTSEIINVSGITDINEICIVNLFGSTIIKNNFLNSKDVKLDLSGISPGIYLLLIKSKNRLYSQRITIISQP